MASSGIMLWNSQTFYNFLVREFLGTVVALMGPFMGGPGVALSNFRNPYVALSKLKMSMSLCRLWKKNYYIPCHSL